MEELHRIFDVTGGKVVLRHDRAAFRSQGPRDGIRRCGRRVHDGYLHQKFQRTLLAYETVELERLPEGDRRRQILHVRSCIRQNFFPGSEKAFLNMLQKDWDAMSSTIRCTPRVRASVTNSDIVPLDTIMTVVARQFALMTDAGV